MEFLFAYLLQISPRPAQFLLRIFLSIFFSNTLYILGSRKLSVTPFILYQRLEETRGIQVQGVWSCHVFWDVMIYRLVNIYRRTEGAYYPHIVIHQRTH